MVRACAICHAAKVKCIRENSDGDNNNNNNDNINEPCQRCRKLSLICRPHESRQGMGKRKRRTTKDDFPSQSAAATITDTALSTNTTGGSVSTDAEQVVVVPIEHGSVKNHPPAHDVRTTTTRLGSMVEGNNNSNRYNNTAAATGCDDDDDAAAAAASSSNHDHTAGEISSMMVPPPDQPPAVSLQLEDEVVRKGIQGLGANHYGLHCLIRQWVSLSFTRRSFNLLSRASFLAGRCGISMDDILSNKSPYAEMTNSQPMNFLPLCMLVPKDKQSVLGSTRVDLRELPWDFLHAIRIDPQQFDDPTRHRWIFIRHTAYGKCRFYASRLFQDDLATIDEIERTWVENKHEVQDLWLAKRQSVKIAEPFFNLLYWMKEPNLTVFVARCTLNVRLKQTQEVVTVDCNVSMKQVDLDTFYYMNEFLFPPNINNNVHRMEETRTSYRNNKRRMSDDSVDSKTNNDPFLDDVDDDNFEYADLTLTDDLEEWLDLVTNIPEVHPSGAPKPTKRPR